MGICGTAMGSLAGILKGMGYQVSGSDQNVYPPMSTQLESLGIRIMEGYKKSHIEPRPDFVIVGNVISRSNEEAQAVLDAGIPYTSLPKAMGEFVIQDRKCLVVAGTHGKTTTTSLGSWVAQECGLKPGFLIGGIPLNFGQSFQIPEGDFFVIEGDEYDTAFFDKVPKFVHYRPSHAILTSVEFDHADIYKDLEDVMKAFRKLLNLIPKDGFLVANGEDKNVVSLLKEKPEVRVFKYGAKSGDYHLGKIVLSPEYAKFEVVFDGKVLTTLSTQLFGQYNWLNTLAIFAVYHQMGIPIEKIQKSIQSFRGVKRRQELLGKPRDITVIEDFAHHPTAVEVTIQALRERFSKNRIIAVFEPRSATSRRNYFQDDYLRAFHAADVSILADVFNRHLLKEDEVLKPEVIVESLKKQNREAYFCKTPDEILALLTKTAAPGDVLLLMSNGGFGGIYPKLLEQLAKETGR